MANVALMLTIALAHFCVYINLWGAAVAASEGGRAVPVWLRWPTMVLGLPVIPLGGCLLTILPHSFRAALTGHDSMAYFYVLAGANAILCGAWTTAQFRIIPIILRILSRHIRHRFATYHA
jgi:hypothetical protein